MNPLCIYHGNCADGFGAAWTVRRYFAGAVDFHAGIYQSLPPDVNGRDVIIVDFSYKRPVMEQIILDAQTVRVLDHHKSAMEDLKDLHGAAVLFDMERSGAMITWNYYFPAEPPPKLIEHIQDRDLWRFQLEGTREIQANLFSYPYEFDVWTELMSKDPEEMRKDGEAIERKHFKDVKELIQVVTRRGIIGGRNVPMANVPYMYSSDAGHLLAEREFFSACYWDTPSGRTFGLRSAEKDGLDVSAIAVQYGGGGHEHAAGFKVSYAEAALFEIEEEAK